MIMLIDWKKLEIPVSKKLQNPYEWQHQNFLSQVNRSLINDADW